MTYYSLATIKNNVEKAWANIDVLLKQRNDELPKLIDTCKAYMTHEAQTLDKVIQVRMGVEAARQMHDINGLAKAELGLQASLGVLFAVAENYPDLKADQAYINLQSRMTGLENQIANRREFYNDSVNINNVRIGHSPDLVVVKAFSFEQKEMLTFSPETLQDVDVGIRLNS